MRIGANVTAVSEALASHGGRREDLRAGAMVVLPCEALIPAAKACREAGFDLLLDVFAIDWLNYPQHQGPRFSVTYSMHHLQANERIMLRVHLHEHESLPSVTGIWPAANYMEREVYDLMGITFDHHPDLRKLVTPEDLDGHPLRKDFPLGESPTLFNDGRFLDPASFRAGIIGASQGRTGWIGGARRGAISRAGDPEGGEA
jgi:NADH-quinone oxidoreductase subunit C